MPITTTLLRQGDNYVLVLDSEMLKHLGVSPDNPAVSLTITGGSLVVTPIPDEERQQRFKEAMLRSIERHDNTFRRLAEE
jgi:antitoxin component of MazEF toxin-antitoxin module